MRTAQTAQAQKPAEDEEKAKTTGKVVAMRGSAPPAEMMDSLEAHAGEGVSTDQADNLVPLVYILQDQSPQVLRRNPNYIEGAEAGCIWLRNAPDPIVPGGLGIEVIPCFFSKDVVEWKPRDDGGGFIARHEFQAGEDIDKLAQRLGAERHVDEKNPQRVIHSLKNGNELVETRYHVVYVVRDGGVMLPFVIPLSSSGHTFSRQWMFKYNSKRLSSGKTAASYACVYRLTTRLRKNAAGEWFMFEEDDGTWLWDRFPEQAPTLFGQCIELHQAFAKGLKHADMPEREAGASATGGAEQHI